MGNEHSKAASVLSVETERTYPTILSKRSTSSSNHSSTSTIKKPYTGSFFTNQHMGASMPRTPKNTKTSINSNRTGSSNPTTPSSISTKPVTFNYFEAAAVTVQPAKKSPTVHSSNSSTRSSSIKSSSVASLHHHPSTKSSINSNVYPPSTNTTTTTTTTTTHFSNRKRSSITSTINSNNNNTISTSEAPTIVQQHDQQQSNITFKTNTSNILDADPSSNYITLNNKTFWKSHTTRHFMLPCDDDESDRLMTMHYILKATFHGNFIAPVQHLLESPLTLKGSTKVLDIGCGPGTWILEMATEFPNAEFYGIDDCPLFPSHIKPINSHFRLHNIFKGLPFKDAEFDYIHMRMMIYYFSPGELAFLLNEIGRVLKPGGYFEIVDTNYTIRHPGPASNKIVNIDLKHTLHAASTSYPTIHATNIASAPSESTNNHPIFSFLLLNPNDDGHSSGNSFIGRFIDICQEHAVLPLGDWPDNGDPKIAKLHSLNFQLLLSSITTNNVGRNSQRMHMQQTTSWPLVDKETIHTILDECDRYRSYLDWFACYARKPPLENEQIQQSTLDSIYEFVEGFVDV
ncbi:hypothetical protein BDF20DRAFT_857399 [Mycotypha africana]|uniref:uncharacterized protein n=1 Tax=Mycotypha africana TaxID=64632 RepID=UPI00230143C4|nr:uncharacterized protein BDF20DRAFT_857399 [Mycotypha africana]KAI8983992.1 hypothetical protein BDF20DRAFT_857399 [Mycotypha africana]